MYALNSGLVEAYPYIITSFADGLISLNARFLVVEAYLKRTGNSVVICELLNRMPFSDFSLSIVRLVNREEVFKPFLIPFLKGKLLDSALDDDMRLSVAECLTVLNDMDGFDFYSQYILDFKRPTDNYKHSMVALQSFSDVAAIPKLLELLLLAKEPEFKSGHFNELESVTLDALTNIAISSRENLEKVKIALLEFCNDNKSKYPDLNFLYLTVKWMEEQYYVKQKPLSIKEAIVEIESIDF
jgi:hypothetical protein